MQGVLVYVSLTSSSSSSSTTFSVVAVGSDAAAGRVRISEIFFFVNSRYWESDSGTNSNSVNSFSVCTRRSVTVSLNA